MGASAQTERVRVLVSDATRLGCELLASALTRSRYHYTVAHTVTTAEEIGAALSQDRVHVALISANLPETPQSVYGVLDRLRTAFPETQPIVLLDSFDRTLVVEFFRRGARGVLCRTEPLKALLKSISQVHKGQIWAGSRDLQLILETLAAATPRPVVDTKGIKLLTQREQDVVNLVTDGLTNREISRRLGLSEHTVKNYLFKVFDKLGVSSRTELILYSLKQRQS